MKHQFITLLLASACTLLADETNQPPGSAPNLQHLTLATNKVAIRVAGEYRLVIANGIPDHQPGEFPNAHNPNRISEQNYTYRVALHPKAAANLTPDQGASFGVALNGVPFEPGTAEFWNNRPDWVIEAKAGFIDLGLDANNAHVQPTGAYHYHGLPTGLLKKLGASTNKMTLVGWAADGFPIYTPVGHTVATNAASPLKTLKSSWRVKSGPRGDDAPTGDYNGKYSRDYEYVRGLGDLDECNGRYGVTPEFTNGVYYYCITEEFPQLARAWRGTPDSSFFKRRTVPQMGKPGMTDWRTEHPRPGRRRTFEGPEGDPNQGPPPNGDPQGGPGGNPPPPQ